MRALTRRERIQRTLSPEPLPEAMIPLLVHAHGLYLAANDRVTTVEARQDTLDRVTGRHVAMLEETLPQRLRAISDAAKRAKHASVVAIDAAHDATRAADRASLGSFRARLRWLIQGK